MNKVNARDLSGAAANGPEITANGSDLPGAAANGPKQAGPSNSAVPDQATEEEGVSPEVKEQKEQARNRVRAWRKVLLDGLDLLVELTAAAASADESDASEEFDLAQECQASCHYH